jgi:hypothetical protein
MGGGSSYQATVRWVEARETTNKTNLDFKGMRVALVSVSGDLHNLPQSISTTVECREVHSKFQPLTPRKTIVSTHPQSIYDRKTSHSKSGIHLAHHRDLSEFRTAKSTKLKALHNSNEWRALSENQKEAAEAEIVLALEEQLKVKMDAHTLEWRGLVERGEIPDDENDSEDVDIENGSMELDETVERDSVEDQSDNSEWMTESASGEEVVDGEIEADPDVALLTNDFLEIKEVSGKA